MSGSVVIMDRLEVDSQVYGTNQQHLVGKVFFHLIDDAGLHQNLNMDVKQVVGSDLAQTPLEVGAIHGYDKPCNFSRMRELVESYYRSHIGPQGRSLAMGPAGSAHIDKCTFASCIPHQLSTGTIQLRVIALPCRNDVSFACKCGSACQIEMMPVSLHAQTVVIGDRLLFACNMALQCSENVKCEKCGTEAPKRALKFGPSFCLPNDNTRYDMRNLLSLAVQKGLV